VSPYIPAGSKIRPPTGVFDHTTILSTVRKVFGLSRALSARDAAAPDLLPALSLTQPANMDLRSVATVNPATSTSAVMERAIVRPNGMQNALARMAMALPSSAPFAPTDVPAPAPAPDIAPKNVLTARVQSVPRVERFLGLR